MAISRESLAKLKEIELYPLLQKVFVAKKFRNVRVTHGNDEQGRDLVGESPDVPSVNMAVVAKVGDISSAMKKGNKTGEVFFQASQCFGAPNETVDPGTDGKVGVVYVVTTGQIKSAALKSLKSSLNGNGMSVEYWDGDRLWAEIQRYLGAASLSDSIITLVDQASNFDSPYQLLPYSRHLRDLPQFGVVSRPKLDLFVVGKDHNAPPINGLFSARVRSEDQERFQRVFVEGGEFHFEAGQARMDCEGPLGEELAETDVRMIRITPLNPTATSTSGNEQTPPLLKYQTLGHDGAVLAESDPFTLSPYMDGTLQHLRSSATGVLKVELKTKDDCSGSLGFGMAIPKGGATAGEYIRAVRFLDSCSRAKNFVTVNLTTGTPSEPWELANNPFKGVGKDRLAVCTALEWAERGAQIKIPPRISKDDWRAAVNLGNHLLRLESMNLANFTLRICGEEAAMWVALSGSREVAIQGFYKGEISIFSTDLGSLYWLIDGPSVKISTKPASEVGPGGGPAPIPLTHDDSENALKDDDVLVEVCPDEKPFTMTLIGDEETFNSQYPDVQMEGPNKNLAIRLDPDTMSRLHTGSFV